VNQVQVDIYKVWLILPRADHVAIPNLLGKGFWLQTHRSIQPVNSSDST